MSERREKLESLIKEYRDLDKQMYKMYIEHDIQIDVYREREKRLKDVMEVVKHRIDMILEFYKTRAGEPNPFRVGVKASPLHSASKI